MFFSDLNPQLGVTDQESLSDNSVEDSGKLIWDFEDEGWFSRSLDAAILDLIRVQQGNPEILRSSPFFRKVAQGGIEALSVYLEVLMVSAARRK